MIPDVDWNDDDSLVEQVFYDHDDDYYGIIHEVKDNDRYGKCVYFKTITHRVSSAQSDSISKDEFKSYVDNGDIEFIGYGKPGIALQYLKLNTTHVRWRTHLMMIICVWMMMNDFFINLRHLIRDRY